MFKYRFTVFTPTYNRESLIHRVFESLKAQDFTDFEWLIVDDGSTDNTGLLIEKYKGEVDFSIRYTKKTNGGKVSAINYALDLAKGFFFLVLDSDDWCDNDALSVLWGTWSELNSAEKQRYSGVSCLKRYADGEIVGQDYSKMNYHGDNYITRFNKRIKGDKWELIRTDLYRLNKYKLLNGEKYMAPEYSWVKIGVNYKTIFLNRALSEIEYQEDGISKNNIRHRVSSATTACEVYRYYISISKGGLLRIRCLINLNRFILHGGGELSLSLTNIMILPFSIALYCYDRFRL